MKHKAKPSGSSGGSSSGRLRLTILLATVAAFLIVPASQAFAASGFVEIAGTGSGELIPVPGSEEEAGTPPINCKYASPGPATGTCATTAFVEEGLNGLKVKGVAAPGSELVEWTVVKGTKLISFCESAKEEKPASETCGAFSTGSKEIKIKAVFNLEPVPNVHIAIAGTGSGSVNGVAPLQGKPPVECDWNGAAQTGVCDVENSHQFPAFDGIKVAHEAAPGSEFTGWTVEEGFVLEEEYCEPLGKTCFVLLEEGEDIKIKATFALEAPPTPEFALTVTKEGGEGTVVSNPAGIECGGTCTDEFEEGKKVTLTASPAAGFKFASWKGCEKGGAIGHTCTVTMDKAKTVVAKFGPVQSLTVGKAGSGTGSVKSSPSGISCDLNCSSNVAAFTEGASVVLTAVPTKYHTFTGWSGSGCSGTGTCTVTMSAAKSVTAEFAATKFNLTLSKAGGGTGAVKSKPASLTCGATCSSVVSSFYAGTEVEVTATPSKGSTLNWSVGSGTCTGSTSPCFVTMSAAKSLTAEFK